MEKGFYTSLDGAKRHRDLKGGWIFARSDGQFIWYAPKFTPSKIMLAPENRGHDGRLL